MEIRLLVIRTSNPERLADFYRLLGMTFEYHKHGNSPFHYATSMGSFVLEIYPLTKTQQEVDSSVRLGFTLDNFEEILMILQENKITFSEPILTDFGYLCVTTDPDGRKVELYKR
jgi:lactoylglutathione lyase